MRSSAFAADNLRHAELVLVVESEHDRLALGPVIAQASSRLHAAIKAGSLAFDSLAGASNLGYKLGLLRDAPCLWHCFLDDDESGRQSFERVKADGLVTHADVHFSKCDDKSEAEVEDLYDPTVYEPMLKNVYGVSIHHPKFKTARKWSDRMRDTFAGQGKQWNDTLKAEVKARVAETVAAQPAVAILASRRAPIDALVKALEDRLAEISSRRR